MNLSDRNLERSLVNRNWEAFKQIRYSSHGEGEIFTLDELNLHGADLRGLPTHFIEFKDCDLSGADFSGSRFFPCAFLRCDMKDVDLSAVSGMMFCIDCDLTGAKFNDESLFFDREHTDAPSAFENCTMDDDLKQFVAEQGCVFVVSDQLRGYAFEPESDESPNT